MMSIPEAVAWYGAFLLSVTLHESAHAWAAMKGGDMTAYAGGQVNLNPLPHIRREPVGMVVLPLISVFLMGWPFGYASAPYDPFWAARHPRKAALMALAGPVTNLLLVILAALGVRAGLSMGAFAPPDTIEYGLIADPIGGPGAVALAHMLSCFFTLNMVLAVLNMIPFPPLDGSAAVTLLMSDDMARKHQQLVRMPGFALIGLVLAWRIFDPIFHLIFLGAVNLLYPGMNYS